MNRLKRVNTNRPAGHDCYLYVISVGTFCKVGISTNPQKRFAAIQTSNPHPIEVVAIYGGTQAECFEIEQSALLAMDKHRQAGEWVELPPDRVTRVVEETCHQPVGQSLRDVVRLNLAALINDAGITQSALALRSGVSQQAISAIQRGTCAPSVDTVEALADALDVPAVALFSRRQWARPTNALESLQQGRAA